LFEKKPREGWKGFLWGKVCQRGLTMRKVKVGEKINSDHRSEKMGRIKNEERTTQVPWFRKKNIGGEKKVQ